MDSILYMGGLYSLHYFSAALDEITVCFRANGLRRNWSTILERSKYARNNTLLFRDPHCIAHVSRGALGLRPFAPAKELTHNCMALVESLARGELARGFDKRNSVL